MKKRKDFETRFKLEGDRPKGKPRALRFPAEIEDVLAQQKDWQAFVIHAVRKELPQQEEWGIEEGDNEVAHEIFKRLRFLMPSVIRKIPSQGRLQLDCEGLLIDMFVYDIPLFQITGSTLFQLQMIDDEWIIEGKDAIAWSELEKAQEFCENMLHIWEQVMISFEFADRID